MKIYFFCFVTIIQTLSGLAQTTEQEKIEETRLLTKEVSKEQVNAVFVLKNDVATGTGFACIYRDKEWVATNLHVVTGTVTPTVTNSEGTTVPLNGYLVYAEDADICLLGVQKSFKTLGIRPLRFSEKVTSTSSIGDGIVCPGNSLGQGLVTLTPGQINGFGPQKVEISNPVFQGNSGGPVIHVKSGSVIGLVTMAYINKKEDNEFTKLSLKSPLSALKDITYIAYRIDTVEKWGACTLEQYLKSEAELAQINSYVSSNCSLILGENDWQSDTRLAKRVKEYEDFLVSVDEQIERGKKQHFRYNMDGTVTRFVTYTGIKIAKSEFDKHFKMFETKVLWKFQSDLDMAEKAKSYGYRQNQHKKLLVQYLDMLVTTIKQ